MKPDIDNFERAMALGNNPRGMMQLLFDKAMEAMAEGQSHILEIGTHQGASALVIMDAMRQSGMADGKFLVTVDPWGFRPYPHAAPVYGEQYQYKAMVTLAKQAEEWGLNWHHFKMTAEEFWTGVLGNATCWYGGTEHLYRFSLIFLDGEHVYESVKREVISFLPYLAMGGYIVIDNMDHFQPDLSRMTDTLPEAVRHLGLTYEEHEFPGDVVGVFRRTVSLELSAEAIQNFQAMGADV